MESQSFVLLCFVLFCFAVATSFPAARLEEVAMKRVAEDTAVLSFLFSVYMYIDVSFTHIHTHTHTHTHKRASGIAGVVNVLRACSLITTATAWCKQGTDRGEEQEEKKKFMQINEINRRITRERKQ